LKGAPSSLNVPGPLSLSFYPSAPRPSFLFYLKVNPFPLPRRDTPFAAPFQVDPFFDDYVSSFSLRVPPCLQRSTPLSPEGQLFLDTGLRPFTPDSFPFFPPNLISPPIGAYWFRGSRPFSFFGLPQGQARSFPPPLVRHLLSSFTW